LPSGVLEEFKEQFELRRHTPGLKPEAPPWTFNSIVVFARLDAFLKRLADIEWLFDTVLEFSKLEKIEIGGILGRSLSARIISVFREFQQLFVAFTARASDVLEPDDESFVADCARFAESIIDLDSKLAAILCQAFDDCGNLESVFKVGVLSLALPLLTFANRVDLISNPAIHLLADKYCRIGAGAASHTKAIHESICSDPRAFKHGIVSGGDPLQSRHSRCSCQSATVGRSSDLHRHAEATYRLGRASFQGHAASVRAKVHTIYLPKVLLFISKQSYSNLRLFRDYFALRNDIRKLIKKTADNK